MKKYREESRCESVIPELVAALGKIEGLIEARGDTGSASKVRELISEYINHEPGELVGDLQLPMSWEELDVDHFLIEYLESYLGEHPLVPWLIAEVQLYDLMNAWNGDWKCPWDGKYYHAIIYTRHGIVADDRYDPEFLVFKTAELRDKFLETFQPLIEDYFSIYE